MGLKQKAKEYFNLWKAQFSFDFPHARAEEGDSVLIIKLDAIGDFIIWLDSAKEYRKLYPNRKLVLLCTKACLSLGQCTGYFDEYLTIDMGKFEKEPSYRQEQFESFSKMGFDTLLQCAYSRTPFMDLLADHIPARQKIAFRADESRSNLRRSVATKKTKKKLDGVYDLLIDTSKEPMMELNRNKDFLRGLGWNYASAMPSLPMLPAEFEVEGDYFLLFPSASTNIKTWDLARFADVTNHLFAMTNWKGVVCGAPCDEHYYQELASMVVTDRLIDGIGKTSLTSLIPLVRDAKFVLSNDTSGIHYAAATNTKGICPFGEYNYGRFLPYAPDEGTSSVQAVCVHKKCRNCADKRKTLKCFMNIFKTGRYLCLDEVTSEEVISKVDQMLSL